MAVDVKSKRLITEFLHPTLSKILIAGGCLQAYKKQIMNKIYLGEYEGITDTNERVVVSVTYEIY